MKKLFMFELGYYLCLHVLGPLLYYQLRGEYVNIYDYCPPEYMNKAAVVIGVPIIITMIIVGVFFPKGKKLIEPTIDRKTDIYFYMGCALILLQQVVAGSYGNLGALNGTILGYMNFFFDLGMLLTVFFVLGTEKINIFLMGFLYLFTTLAGSSRQGALVLVVAFLVMLISTDKYKKYRKHISILILCICLASPFAYMYATAQRGSNAGTGVQLIDHIVGRCSELELLGIALYQKENDIWVKELFEEKYSIENQVKQCVNSLMIGDVFEGDVQPNQYYRAIFLRVPEQQAKDTYTSINLTFSGYLYLKYPLIVSWIFTIGILLAIYIVATTCKWPKIFSVIMILFVTNSILDYFDWVMILNTMLRYIIAGGTFWCLNNIVKMYVPRLVLSKTKLKFTK